MALAKTVKDQVNELFNQGGELALHRARMLIREQLRSFPNDPELHHANAEIHLALGQVDEALAPIRAAVKLAPQAARVRQTLGIWHLMKDQLAEAIEELTLSMELDPTDTSTLVHLTLAHARRRTSDDQKQGTLLLSQLIGKQIDNYRALRLLAFSALRLGHQDLGLQTVASLWRYLSQKEGRPDWFGDLPQIPETFLFDQLHTMVFEQRTQDNIRMDDVVDLAKQLILEGVSREEVLDQVAGYLSDEPDTDADDADLLRRAEAAHAEGDYRPYPIKSE